MTTKSLLMRPGVRAPTCPSGPCYAQGRSQPNTAGRAKIFSGGAKYLGYHLF